jgi:hypothetical protein
MTSRNPVILSLAEVYYFVVPSSRLQIKTGKYTANKHLAKGTKCQKMSEQLPDCAASHPRR